MRKQFGFTLIEVALFLALTGVLFVGIAVGTQNTITEQRYNDSVQNFAEFLRGIYSEVSNPQSISAGRSETTAIYGKLVVFGEDAGLDGNEILDNEQRVFVYDVVGEVANSTTLKGTGSVVSLLNELNANVVVPVKRGGDSSGGDEILLLKKDGIYRKKNNVGDEFEKVNSTTDDYVMEPAGIVESYAPRWQAEIEKTNGGDGSYRSGSINGENDRWTGSILVVRHPRSGTVNTLVAEGTVIEVNKAIEEYEEKKEISIVSMLLTDKLGDFKATQVDFCINHYGWGNPSSTRRDIRIEKDARNASAVEIINLDDSANACRKWD
ncbi:prepilin-type N-terminal cleavage/methylation domain-containing protein [Candidatus Saccharibacteria bacterium]|nr:prepilin-type N-terminal cleavage/methylation domain-containing protein [Candidatus Saccharibacteria bacterium]